LIKKNNTVLFLIAAIYPAGRVILFSPNAIEKKSKRLIFLPEQHFSHVNESRQRLLFFEMKHGRLPQEVLLNNNSIKQIGFQSVCQYETSTTYTGKRILASPGEPDDICFC